MMFGTHGGRLERHEENALDRKVATVNGENEKTEEWGLG